MLSTEMSLFLLLGWLLIIGYDLVCPGFTVEPCEPPDLVFLC